MTYDYSSGNLKWQITVLRDESAHLHRFIPEDNPPYGGRFYFLSDHDDRLKAEAAANAIEEEEFGECLP